MISSSSWAARLRRGAALLSFLFASSSATAQTVITPLERPDAASVTVPDMESFKPTPRDTRGFGDYFYFHKDGVSYERAFAEMEICRVYAAMAQVIPPISNIIPVGDVPVQTAGPRFGIVSQFGIIGGGFANALIAQGESDNAVATNRRCMAYKGYRRYGTSRGLFKQIDSGSDTEKQARRALVASGPTPSTGAMDP